MGKNKTITVQGNTISIHSYPKQEDFISLTDIMKSFDDEYSIYSWMRNKNTVEYLGVWEQLHNDSFKGNEFVTFSNQAGANNFNLTPKKWINATDAIGMRVKSGRGGGTYAHQDIAIHFCSWLSPTFQLYLVKEFQRLKEEEADQNNLDWKVKRIMTKANYQIHSEAVRKHLIPPRYEKTRKEGMFFANEADILNIALFGKTAKQWKIENPNKKGNMRDHATPEQLLILSNLQSLNAKLIKWDCDAEQRAKILNESAIEEMNILISNASLKQLSNNKTKKLE